MFLKDMLDLCDPDYQGHGSIYFDDSEWNEIFDEIDKQEK